MKIVISFKITFCLFLLYFVSCEKDISALKVLTNDVPYVEPDIVSLQVGNWYSFHGYAGDDQYVIDFFFKRKIIGDTLINSDQYFIKANENGSKDYLRIHENLVLFFDHEEDHILFNFHLSEGDTFIYENKVLIVDSIEFINISVPFEEQIFFHLSNKQLVTSDSRVISLGYASKFGLVYYWESKINDFQGYRITEALIDSILYDL